MALLRKLWGHREEFASFLARKDAYQAEGMFYGGVREDELPLLEALVHEAADHPGPIIEIGTLLGLTTVILAALKRPDQRLITVDSYVWNPWSLSPEEHRRFTERVLYYLRSSGSLDIVAQDKADYYREYGGPPPSLVFLDADHHLEPTREDIRWAQRVGARAIAGHDYGREFPGVCQAVDEVGGPARLLGTLWCLPVGSAGPEPRTAGNGS
jgi:predicted O-methyltransferase YrrM